MRHAQIEAVVRTFLAGSSVARVAKDAGAHGADLIAALDRDSVEIADAIMRLNPNEGAVSGETLEVAYKRFMAEWKRVGVWQGGKPVKQKLARLIKAGQIDDVWAGLERLRNDPNRPAPQFVPRPLTWLNQERWNDDPYPVQGRSGAASAVLGIELPPAQRPSIQGEIAQGRWFDEP